MALETEAVRLEAANANGIAARYDLVLDGSDNFETRYLMNKVCARWGVPLISAAMSQWEGQVALFDPRRGGPCYACVFPEPPAAGLAPSCAEAGRGRGPCRASWDRFMAAGGDQARGTRGVKGCVAGC